MSSKRNKVQGRLIWLAALLLPALGHSHDYPARAGIELALDLAVSLRSSDQLPERASDPASTAPWQIPGLLMGGHASPYQRGAHLDELSLWLGWRGRHDSYGIIKLASHGGDGHGSQAELENAYLGQIFGVSAQPWRIEAGRMTAAFSPVNHDHPANAQFSLAPLAYDAWLGRHVVDDGLRLLLGDSEQGWSMGLEAYRGDSFPAGHGDGLYDAFVRHARRDFHWDWTVQIWGMRANAKARGDGRLHAGHDHGLTGTLPVHFTGNTELAGLYGELGWTWGHQRRVALRAEWIDVEQAGELSDGSRLLDLEGSHHGMHIMPQLQWGNHRLALRYERLYLDNLLRGPAAEMLGNDAGLINNGHDPRRLALGWHWQYSPSLAWRVEWLRDDSMPERRQLTTLGLVWREQRAFR